MLSKTEVAWAAGYFEGEGCFRRNGNSVRVHLKNTDLDSLERFQRAVGFGNINGPYDNGLRRKPVWHWDAYGFEKTQALTAMFWSFLGRRRKDRARGLMIEE